jgi:hypothetical protein
LCGECKNRKKHWKKSHPHKDQEREKEKKEKKRFFSLSFFFSFVSSLSLTALVRREEEMAEPTAQELVDICNNFMLSSPPGEFMEVVTDIRGLLSNESVRWSNSKP